jgi:hypothetical protein
MGGSGSRREKTSHGGTEAQRKSKETEEEIRAKEAKKKRGPFFSSAVLRDSVSPCGIFRTTGALRGAPP